MFQLRLATIILSALLFFGAFGIQTDDVYWDVGVELADSDFSTPDHFTDVFGTRDRWVRISYRGIGENGKGGQMHYLLQGYAGSSLDEKTAACAEFYKCFNELPGTLTTTYKAGPDLNTGICAGTGATNFIGAGFEMYFTVLQRQPSYHDDYARIVATCFAVGYDKFVADNNSRTNSCTPKQCYPTLSTTCACNS